MSTDPTVDAYINSILNAQNSAQASSSPPPKSPVIPTHRTDTGVLVATRSDYDRAAAIDAQNYQNWYTQQQTASKAGPTYIASDGKSFTNPDDYRTYQTQIDTTNHQTAVTSALAQARLNAQNEVTQKGLKYSDYSAPIEAQINSILGIIPEWDTNPSSFFDPNLADNVLSGIENTNRNQYTNQVSSTFNPNYDTTALPDSLLQGTVAQILGTQQGMAQDALDRGLKRGQFNQVGYDAGAKNIASQASGINSNLLSDESNVLNSYRDRLDTVANNARGAAGSYTLGQNFNLGDYTGAADNIINEAKTRAPGDLQNLVGNAPLFDISSLINAGGEAQGAQNLQNTDVAAAVAAKKKSDATSRGLGSTGAF